MATTRRLSDEQAALAARYTNLALRLAYRFGRRSRWRLDGPDLTSDALLALCTAARDYEPGHPSGLAFATFARWRIVGRLSAARRPAEERWPPESVDESLSTTPDRSRRTNGARARFWTRRPARDDADGLLSLLPRKNAEVLELIALGGLTQAEAAARLGKSQAEISRLMKQSRELLGA